MSVSSDQEVVLADTPAAGRAKLYQWVLDHLAKFPGRVTVVTFAAAAAVTAIVAVVDGDWSLTTIVSLVAALWALFFGVMIYLLTARDTDNVLDQIADLHEQLATALTAPDDEEGTGQEETSAPARASSAGTTPPVPDESGSASSGIDGLPPHELDRGTGWTGEGRGDGWPHSESESGGADQARATARTQLAPRMLVGKDAIVAGVPSDILDAWASATAKSRDDLSRAWSRDPRSDRQWVLETAGRERWVVFTRGARGIGVISLDDRRRSGTQRSAS
jgi:hypothetical protein